MVCLMKYLRGWFIACFTCTTVNSFAYKVITENEKTKNLGYGEWVIKTDGELDLMQKLIRPVDTVFDVGANVGEWSLYALELNRSIQLYAFELLPSIFT